MRIDFSTFVHKSSIAVMPVMSMVSCIFIV